MTLLIINKAILFKTTKINHFHHNHKIKLNNLINQ